MNTAAREQTVAFLEAMAEGATEASWIELTLNKCKKGLAFPADAAGIAKCAATVAQWEGLENEMHIGAAPRWRKPTGNNGRALEADVSAVPWLWVDIDSPTAQEALDAFQVKPTLIVASGRPGHRQAYWRLTELASKDDAKSAMKLLAGALGGDSVANMDRVMRCPGTTNRKPESAGATVQIAHMDDRRVTLTEILEACPERPAPALTPAYERVATSDSAHEWDTSKDSLTVEEVERLDRVTGDTPSKDKTKIREHAKRKMVHARTGLANAATSPKGYGAQQLLGVARDIGRCLGGGLLYADALRMLQDFEQEMGATSDDHVKNNARALRRGLAQGAGQPWRPGREESRATVTQDSAGGLRTHGNRTMVATMGDEGPGEALFMDGAIEVVGVVGTDEPGVNEAYEILLTVGDKQYEQYLEIKDMANAQLFSAWCLARGLSIFFVQSAVPSGLTSVQRINRFLLSQGAKASIVVPCLGWHRPTSTFLTVEGRITRDGFTPGHDAVRPHPHLVKRGLTGYRYGATETTGAARDALREVMTWQHPMTAAIMGSWWATTFLKQHIRQAAGDGLYPFLGLEGNSGTGKTSGMLKSLLELGGAPGKPQSGNTTIAAFRSMLGAHNAGAIWLDDSDRVQDDALWELIRGTTGDATFSKKAEDRGNNASEPLTAAVVISGEGLNVRGQKANLERCVLLTPEDPTDRMDPRQPLRPQWEAITEFRRDHPDLNEYAASIVQLALAEAGEIAKLPKLTGGLPGRRGEKAAILRLGAIVLERMTNQPGGTYGRYVETWIEGNVLPETANSFESIFMARLLVVQPPVELSNAGAMPDGPGRAKSPIFYDPEGEYYVSVERGIQWCLDKRIEIPSRYADAYSMAEQAKAAGCEKVRKRIEGGGRHTNPSRVWKLPHDMLVRLGLREDESPLEDDAPFTGTLC